MLGGCAGGLSREHIITKALYEGTVEATGLPWTGGRKVELPINAIASNVLCVKHNNDLSPVDAEAVRLKRFVVAAEGRGSDAVRAGRRAFETVDGKKVVRWLCKEVCNVVAMRGDMPDAAYVHGAFGTPNGRSASVYIRKPIQTRIASNSGRFVVWEYWAQQASAEDLAVYVIRLGYTEWLVSPRRLSQRELDVLGRSSSYQHWFEVRRLESTFRLCFNIAETGSGDRTHQLTLKFPRKQRSKKGSHGR